MKRLMVIIAAVLMVAQGKAWLVESDVETLSKKVSSSNFTRRFPTSTYSWVDASGAYIYQDNSTGFYITLLNSGKSIWCVNNVKPSVNSTAEVSGFVIGRDNDEDFTINIGCSSYANRPILRVELDYVFIGDDENAKPAFFNTTGEVSYSMTDKGDGLKRGHAVYKPYLPITNAIVTYFSGLNPAKDADFVNKWGNGIRGCIVTDITVEYVKGNSLGTVTQDLVSSYAQNKAEWLYHKDVIQMVSHDKDLVGEHYQHSSKADVDENGKVNSADVVKVYNHIQIGTPNEYNGHQYVNLGLPSGIMWASCNVGAPVPEALGDYYAYNDYRGYLRDNKQVFDSKNYVANESPCEGWEGWELPTSTDITELLDNTTRSIEYINGVKCTVFTSTKNGAQLIMPHYGYISTDGLGGEDYGYFWTSTVHDGEGKKTIFKTNGAYSLKQGFVKTVGLNIRYICKP